MIINFKKLSIILLIFSFSFLAAKGFALTKNQPHFASIGKNKVNNLFEATMKNTEDATNKRTLSETTISQPLFSDDFERPGGLIAVEGRNGQQDPLGKWKVTSGSLYTKNAQGYTRDPVFRVVTRQSNFRNFALSADMLKTKLGIDAWDGLQLFFRYNDPDNLYAAGLRNDNSIHLKKKVKGTYTTLAIAPVNSNKLYYRYNLKVLAAGDHIEVFVDGQKYIDVRDSSFQTGRVGIRTDNIEAYFDNFDVNAK